ncbi:hypothetical protein B484DRAFT_403197 [Ochromonadaceae sp. CCMP2298]|nr:hypothetical protein B484DRAFT_403197 [Ochromonadaceae sp. CCMP2298]
MTSEGKKTGGAIVLESSAMTPWKFAEWSNAMATKLAIADLGDLLTGERSSIFEDPKPMFSWEIAIEVRVRDPSSDASSLGDDLRSTIGGETGDTRPYSFAEGRKNEESPPTKGQAYPLRDRDSEGKTFAYPTQTVRRSPGVAERDLDVHLFLTKTEEAYFARREEFRKDRQQWDKDREFLRGEVTKALAILTPTISAKVQLQFRAVISSRDVAAIWETLRDECGASTASDGLTDLLSSGRKDGDDLKIQMRRALMHDATHWDTWKDELKASERLSEVWEVLKLRLTTAASEIAHDELTMKSIGGRGGSRFDGKAAAQQALAATPEGQALISQTRSNERKKTGGGKPDGKADGGPGKGTKGGPKAAVAEEDEVSGAAQVSEAEAAVKRQSLCFECGLRGHIAANCPWAKNFKKLRADCKAKQGDKADPAAEASNCWVSDAGAEEANAEAGTWEELIEDWLAGAGGEHSLAAHVEEAEAPIDVPAKAAPATSTAAVDERRPLATHNRFAVLMLTSSGSDSDSDHVDEGRDSSDGGSASDSDGEEGHYSSTPADLGGLPPVYGAWLADAQEPTPLELLHLRSGHPTEIPLHHAGMGGALVLSYAEAVGAEATASVCLPCLDQGHRGTGVPPARPACDDRCRCNECKARFPDETDMPDLTRADSDSDDEDDGGDYQPGGASAKGPLTVQISMYLDDFLLTVRTEERK